MKITLISNGYEFFVKNCNQHLVTMAIESKNKWFAGMKVVGFSRLMLSEFAHNVHFNLGG